MTVRPALHFALAMLCCVHAEAADLTERILAGTGAVYERQSGFHETRVIGALTAPLESSGTLIWHAPDFLEKLTLAPRREDMVIHGAMVTIARGDGPAHAMAKGDSPALQLMADTLLGPLAGNSALLRRYYRIAASGEEGGAWTLTLTPDSDDTAKLIHDVVITGRNNAILSLKIVQAGGDTQTITVTP